MYDLDFERGEGFIFHPQDNDYHLCVPLLLNNKKVPKKARDLLSQILALSDVSAASANPHGPFVTAKKLAERMNIKRVSNLYRTVGIAAELGLVKETEANWVGGKLRRKFYVVNDLKAVLSQPSMVAPTPSQPNLKNFTEANNLLPRLKRNTQPPAHGSFLRGLERLNKFLPPASVTVRDYVSESVIDGRPVIVSATNTNPLGTVMNLSDSVRLYALMQLTFDFAHGHHSTLCEQHDLAPSKIPLTINDYLRFRGKPLDERTRNSESEAINRCIDTVFNFDQLTGIDFLGTNSKLFAQKKFHFFDLVDTERFSARGAKIRDNAVYRDTVAWYLAWRPEIYKKFMADQTVFAIPRQIYQAPEILFLLFLHFRSLRENDDKAPVVFTLEMLHADLGKHQRTDKFGSSLINAIDKWCSKDHANCNVRGIGGKWVFDLGGYLVTAQEKDTGQSGVLSTIAVVVDTQRMRLAAGLSGDGTTPVRENPLRALPAVAEAYPPEEVSFSFLRKIVGSIQVKKARSVGEIVVNGTSIPLSYYDSELSQELVAEHIAELSKNPVDEAVFSSLKLFVASVMDGKLTPLTVTGTPISRHDFAALLSELRRHRDFDALSERDLLDVIRRQKAAKVKIALAKDGPLEASRIPVLHELLKANLINV